VSAPCKYCNDEGVVHTHTGDVIGPCSCVSDDVKPYTREELDSLALARRLSNPLMNDDDTTAISFGVARRLLATARAGLEDREQGINQDLIARVEQTIRREANNLHPDTLNTHRDILRRIADSLRAALDAARGVATAPDDQAAADTEFGWLIEVKGAVDGRYSWYTGGPDGFWTNDASKALRFARKQDAELVMGRDRNVFERCIATQHGFDTPRSGLAPKGGGE
jgi:hypothetical protein